MASLREDLSSCLEQAIPGLVVEAVAGSQLLSVLFRGKAFAHIHASDEFDVKLTRATIRRQKLSHPLESTVHPRRSANSAWIEIPFRSHDDFAEIIRLAEIAVSQLER